eukprot:SM000049S16791  [mRNA]  locus=s49:744747:762811:- [translate_table: standard]
MGCPSSSGLLRAIAALLVTFLTAVGPTFSAAQTPWDVPIGALVDSASSLGASTLCGINLAIRDVNANDSILPTTRLLLDVGNAGQDPLQGAAEALAQLQRSVVALVGPTYSTVARFVSNMGAAAQVPVLSFAATDPTLSNKARYPYFVRVTHNDQVEMAALADLVKYYQWQRIIVIYADDDFGRNGVLAFSAALAPEEVTIDAQVAVDLNANLTVVTKLLGQLRQHETTVFLAHLQPQLVPLVIEAGKFKRPHHVSAANSLGMLTPGHVWIASDSTMSILADLPSSVLQLGQGIIGTRSYIPKTELLMRVTENWKMLNHTLYPCAGANAMSPYTLFAYETVWVVAHALEQFLNRGGSFNFKPSTTPLDAQSGGNTQLGDLLVNTGGADFLSTIYDTTFEGLTGRIAFDKQGDLPSPTFQIVNLVGNAARVIGYWSSAFTFTTAAPKQVSAVSTRHANASNSSTGDRNMLGVVWPGGGILIPRGWLFKGVKPLIIAVPNKQGYKEFVSVGDGTSNDRFQGYCIEVFRAALEQLPYDVPYMFVSFGDGSTTPNYTQMVQAVANKAFDAAVGDITITAERSLIVDFTQPYVSSGLVVVVPQHGKGASTWAFTKPFSYLMWLFILMFLLGNAFVMWVVEEHAKVRKRNEGPKQQVVTMLWFSFNTLFFNLTADVTTILGRLVVTVWLVVVLILTSSYTASLTSLLTVQQLSASVQSISELISSGQSIAYQAGSFVNGYLSGLGVPQSRLVPEQTYEDYNNVLKSGAVGAIVDEIPYMELFLSKYCKYAIVGQEFTKSGWGFVFQQGSPLAADMSSTILSMSRTGELERIHDRWLTPSSECGQDATQLQSTALGLDTYWGLFAIVGSVYVLAVLWHVCTRLHNWQVKRRINRVRTEDVPNNGPGYDLRNSGSFPHSHQTTSVEPAEQARPPIGLLTPGCLLDLVPGLGARSIAPALCHPTGAIDSAKSPSSRACSAATPLPPSRGSSAQVLLGNCARPCQPLLVQRRTALHDPAPRGGMGCPSSSAMLRAIAALLLPLLAAVGPTLTAAQVSWDVPIGALVDFASSIGTDTLCGIKLAVGDVNADNSILPTTRLLLDVGNAGQDPLQGAAEALAQLRRSVVALVGPTYSTVARFVSNMGAAAQVPVLSFAATDPTLSIKARYPYFVRVTHNDKVEMEALADLVRQYQWQHSIVIYADDDFGRNGVLAFSAALASQEVTIDAQVAVDLDANLTLVTELLGQLRQHETTVFMAHLQPQLVPLGIIGTRSYIPKTEVFRRVTENWKLLNHTLYPCAGANAINSYTLYAYDTVWVVAHALEQFLKEGGSFKFAPSATPLDAQSGGDTQLGEILVNTGGAKFLNTVYNTSFEGLTGRIAFDKQGDLPSPTFQIVNLVGNTARVIGYWSSASTFTTAAPEQASATSIRNASSSNSSTGGTRLLGVIWPGGGILIPRGWLFKGVKPLIIAVPYKQGYKEFVSVGDGTGNDRFQGYCIEIFRAALEQLDYNVPYMFVSFGDGSTTPNYTQMVEAVANKAFDAAVGDITVTAERSLIVDFTQPYESSGLVVVVPQKGTSASPWAFTKPFAWSLWLFIGGLLVLHAFVVWLLEERAKEKEVKGGLKQQLVTMLWFSFNTLFFNLPTTVTTTPGRLVVIVWLVVVLILTSSYTASLTSLLTVQQLSSSIQSVAELILSGQSIAYQAGSFVDAYLRGLGVLQSRLVPEQTYEDYNNVLKSGAVGAIVDESPYMELFLSKYCNYAIVGQEFTKSGWGFVFQQGSLLATDISSAILSMSGSGELQRIHDRWLASSNQCGQDSTQLQSAALGLDTYWGLFAITGSLYLLAVVWPTKRVLPDGEAGQANGPSLEDSGFVPRGLQMTDLCPDTRPTSESNSEGDLLS